MTDRGGVIMRHKTAFCALRRRQRGRDERSIALLTTLLILLVLTGISLAMVMSVKSDMLVNGFYRNYRGSFYAADSGLSVVRGDFANQVQANALQNFSATTQPIPPGTDAIVQAYILSKYGQPQALT